MKKQSIEAEKDNLFFVTKAKELDIDKMEIMPVIKTKWKQKCKRAITRNKKSKEEIQLFSDIMGFREGIKILDVGCGIGAEAIELSYLGADCTGLDAAEDAIRVVNQVRNDFKLNMRGVYGDACHLPFDDETFDVVMSREFFEHVADFDLAMKEQVRVLKRDGRLIIEQANFLNPLTLISLLIRYPIRSRGKFGGVKWLLTKSKVRENIYGTGWSGKDEDVHTRLWWRVKMRQYSELKINEFTSSMARNRSKFFRMMAPLVGNILIVATKQ
ncbi:class I SAM-dependent methyltransferase [Candidatus Omnitrophota bacterium]